MTKLRYRKCRSINSISRIAQPVEAERTAFWPERNIYLFALCLAAIVLIISMASASSINSANASASNASGPTDPNELAAFMDGAVSSILKAHNIPGATAAVVKDGQVIFEKGYGYADIDKREPVLANRTLFRVGSVSKLFIWTAVMQLAEEGRLDLNADVNTYLQNFQIPATYPQPITLKNLMSHTSGFEDLAIGGRVFVHNASDIIPLDEYLKDNMPARVRPPGEVTAYSNYGSALAAYIVEQVSGLPFDRYVEEKILHPLDMNSTTFEQPLPPELVLNMSEGYRFSSNVYTAEPFEYLQIWPAGSMSSTSEDMAKFMIAHLQNGRYGNTSILQEATAQQMHSQLFTNDPEVNGMAYGFWEARLNNQSMIMHGGDTILFHTLLVLLPKDHLGLFISSNEQSSEPAIYELLQAFMDHYYPLPPQPVPRAISGFDENASKFEGSYRMTRSAYTNFEKIGSLFQETRVSIGPNSTLIISQPLQGSEQWVEVAPLVFRPADGLPSQDSLVFGEDGQGSINHLFYVNNPTTAYERVAWYEDASFNFALLGACILLFLSTLIWPAGFILNRYSIKSKPMKPSSEMPSQQPSSQQQPNQQLNQQPSQQLSQRPGNAARWIAGGSSMLNLLFLMGLLSVLLASPTEAEFIYTIPPWLTALLAIALIAAFLSLGSIIFAALAWMKGYWSLPGRLHYTLVVLALLSFVWWLNNWNLLGFKF